MNIFDMLLLPKKLYQKVTDRKSTLYIGFILVGIIDLSTFIIDDFTRLFYGRPASTLFYNITLAILLAVFIGFIDVLFFSVPLFDLFKMFKRENVDASSRTLIRFMKTYILVNFLVLPINLIIYTVYSNMDKLGISLDNNYSILFVILLIDLLTSIWFSGAAARGANVIYKFDPRLKNAVFMTIFTWSYILAQVFNFMIDKWAMPLFK
ncbi:hypothetical protein CDQ84_11610 [Clostridium thermosuccinogenes]|mgnify:CR=1 FL=1|uniref:Yip1 domain-containing protein n=1 Tax=Clostridium thermosuccinogenes TaxID=84032 RepID=A0A2K2EX42_9CLOT|nr:hypothetical protein [Pseudoclostridium thermosuccinogenes]AUS98255.1 hypothetical protein CDO33_18410 [Pseudoclostridium thermosuccinogenes]PNT91097.1 hypothetical protein CDQ83_14875 [Pseudoclostridium thermosuccinogenes]PNT96483.1 hypothetical protein CDQ85_11635 [Pseudoclostridium thermosuccinogenes]PNT98137.1 hypothetical protein CDQ84_11610 [Pseudoclostridium thermosuccinogenes]